MRSGRHLSTDGINPQIYMQEYRLSPDKLCSKSFRINHSSRRDYGPHNKREWIVAIKSIHKQHGQVFAGYLQDNLPSSSASRCNSYLGFVLRELGRNMPVRAVNAHCLECGYRLASSLREEQAAQHHQLRKTRYAEPTKDS